MKKILALITLSLGISLAPFSASAHGPAPQKVEKTITIKADPAKVWAIVKDFGNMHQWHPGVASTKLEQKKDDNGDLATYRTLTFKAGGQQSFCKSGRSAKDNYFRFAKVHEHSIFVSSISVDNGYKPHYW